MKFKDLKVGYVFEDLDDGEIITITNLDKIGSYIYIITEHYNPLSLKGGFEYFDNGYPDDTFCNVRFINPSFDLGI